MTTPDKNARGAPAGPVSNTGVVVPSNMAAAPVNNKPAAKVPTDLFGRPVSKGPRNTNIAASSKQGSQQSSSSSFFKPPPQTSQALTKEDIKVHGAPTLKQLGKQGLRFGQSYVAQSVNRVRPAQPQSQNLPTHEAAANLTGTMSAVSVSQTGPVSTGPRGSTTERPPNQVSQQSSLGTFFRSPTRTSQTITKDDIKTHGVPIFKVVGQQGLRMGTSMGGQLIGSINPFADLVSAESVMGMVPTDGLSTDLTDAMASLGVPQVDATITSVNDNVLTSEAADQLGCLVDPSAPASVELAGEQGPAQPSGSANALLPLDGVVPADSMTEMSTSDIGLTSDAANQQNSSGDPGATATAPLASDLGPDTTSPISTSQVDTTATGTSDIGLTSDTANQLNYLGDPGATAIAPLASDLGPDTLSSISVSQGDTSALNTNDIGQTSDAANQLSATASAALAGEQDTAQLSAYATSPLDGVVSAELLTERLPTDDSTASVALASGQGSAQPSGSASGAHARKTNNIGVDATSNTVSNQLSNTRTLNQVNLRPSIQVNTGALEPADRQSSAQPSMPVDSAPDTPIGKTGTHMPSKIVPDEVTMNPSIKPSTDHPAVPIASAPTALAQGEDDTGEGDIGVEARNTAKKAFFRKQLIGEQASSSALGSPAKRIFGRKSQR